MTRLLALLCLTATALPAEDFGKLIFSDDFQRTASQETKDEPGNGWGTNSAGRAKNNKQVDLRNGAMYIYIHKEANHAVSVTHPAVFTDGAVAMRFMLEDAKDSLGLDFADMECKTVHAGHLFKATFGAKSVALADLKTGNMDLKIQEARLAKTLTKEQTAALKEKEKSFPWPIEIGKWHELTVKVEGDEISATVDGKSVGSLKSAGIAHPTKQMLRLSVPRNAVVDDVKIWCKK